MDAPTINALVNMGSAGAVIAVVVIFLRSIRERDAEWRNFFTTLNVGNKDDVCKLAELMKQMVDKLDRHDDQAREIKSEVINAIREIATQPARRPAAK